MESLRVKEVDIIGDKEVDIMTLLLTWSYISKLRIDYTVSLGSQIVYIQTINKSWRKVRLLCFTSPHRRNPYSLSGSPEEVST